ncbi:MAG: nucleotidyltransferase domain-containing protein [Fimbriimonadales bacterium]|nr:MAG: hypothetical protein KatS3mg018_2373 [Fimbriimonadales bacterium]
MTSDSLLQRFVQEVLPVICERLQPERVILFGSRARGEARCGSDLDVIVVAQAFADVPFLQRMPMMLRLARFPRHIDYLCYTPAEFEQAIQTSTLVNAAVREGRVLYPDSEEQAKPLSAATSTQV